MVSNQYFFGKCHRRDNPFEAVIGRRSMRKARSLALFAGFALLCGIAAALFLVVREQIEPFEGAIQPGGYEARTGSRFLPLPEKPFQAPRVRELAVPQFANATSVWGATGRDSGGNIWVGVSASGMSAHLLRYDPEAETWRDGGAVVEKLKAAGRYRDGEGQIKIHSKIVPADDGWLYFASTDEEGESDVTMVPPRWGGHLWRINPRDLQWQHLLAVPEGLVAASGSGRYVYALGYWGHVLYQYDVSGRTTRRVVVGSVQGHVSRNFLTDTSGHAYVPRLSMQPAGKVLAELVEYDSDLRELASTPLDFYLGAASPGSNHGIVGVAYLADGRMVFTTDRGQLYLIEPRLERHAVVTAVGWFHPEGEAYAPSLFSFDGKSLLAGVTQRAGRYEWVVFDLATRISGAFPLDTKDLRKVLLYGSISRDNAGRFYVAGWATGESGGQRPLVLQVTAPP
jgi:hypothetical protein